MPCLPGSGTPTLAAHLTVLAYAFAALACGLNAWRGRAGVERGLWAGFALALLVLGLVEHFDLDLVLLEKVRGLFGGSGLLLATAVGFVSILGVIAAGLAIRGRLRLEAGAMLAGAGLAGLGGFVAARAGYFDRVDGWVGFDLVTPCSFRVPELVALALVIGGARVRAWRGPAR